jgi:hypothetical protein
MYSISSSLVASSCLLSMAVRQKVREPSSTVECQHAFIGASGYHLETPCDPPVRSPQAVVMQAQVDLSPSVSGPVDDRRGAVAEGCGAERLQKLFHQ